MNSIEILGACCLLLAGLGTAYLLFGTVLVARFHGAPEEADARARDAGAALPSVTILKPLHGAEPGLLDNLLSLCRQDYAGTVQVVAGIQDPEDPAGAVVAELRRLCPDHDVTLVVDRRLHGTNRKVSNLANMARVARGEVVVLADSDMRVPPDYLTRLVAALERPGIGAVTCLYHGLPAAGIWSRLAALGIDGHFLPGVVTGLSLGLARPCMGSTIALRRGTLERIGGFARVADALADDYEIGAAVRALGLEVAVPAFAIGHVCPEPDVAALLRQELRWQRTIRLIDPAGHAGSILTHPFPFALAGFALFPGAAAATFVFTAIIARMALCLAVERRFRLKPGPYWLIPARDLLSVCVFAASFLGRGVSWRGRHFNVARSGALLPTTRPDPT